VRESAVHKVESRREKCLECRSQRAHRNDCQWRLRSPPTPPSTALRPCVHAIAAPFPLSRSLLARGPWRMFLSVRVHAPMRRACVAACINGAPGFTLLSLSFPGAQRESASSSLALFALQGAQDCDFAHRFVVSVCGQRCCHRTAPRLLPAAR
jgi:hypothetical protein